MGIRSNMSRIRAQLRANEGQTQRYIRTGLKSNLRRLWLRSEFRNECLRRDRVVNDAWKGKVKRYHYPCEECGALKKSSEVEIDHLDGVSSLFTLDDLPKFMATLFCPTDRLARLCKGCHDLKTYGTGDL